MYGLLLEEAGFTCPNLILSIAVITRKLEPKSEELKNRLPRLVLEYLDAFKSLPTEIKKEDLLFLSEMRSRNFKDVADLMSSGSLRIFLFPYSRKDALGYVLRSRDYWLGLRPPLYNSRSENKCRNCEYGNARYVNIVLLSNNLDSLFTSKYD
ncbi:MAG: hypothetical protein QW491_14875 [Thermoproteota archaeon]